MKKVYLSFAFAAFALAGTAQVQRMVMAEAFSNASCPPCASQNPAYNALLAGNTAKVIAVKYQTNWPGADPMNAQTQSMVGPRVSYYGVTGVPYGRLDGVAYAGSSYSGALANLDQSEIDARYGVDAPFSVDVTHSFNNGLDSIFIRVIITAETNINIANFKAHVLLTEREIAFQSAPGTNGETVFHHVMRAMYPNSNGTTLASNWVNGDDDTLDFAVAIPAYIYDKSELEVIAFVQDNTSKEVHQAGLSQPVPLPDFGRNDGLSGVSAYECSADVNGDITLFNKGANAITSCTINYKIDNGNFQTFAWSGNSIAPGASLALSIPTINGVAAGTHTLTAYCSDINNSANSTAQSSTSFTIASAPVAAPMTQNFQPTTFPPSTWGVNNYGEQYGWTRVTSNAYVSGSGSSRCAFYYIPQGGTRQLYTGRYDISAQPNPALQFDVAYAPYNNTYIDELEVLVSTDCGANWTQVYSKSTGTLNTAPANTNSFAPTNSQWRTEMVSLSSYSTATDLLVQFNGISGYGNNVLVDNVNIGTNTTGLDDAKDVNFGVFPNPAVDFTNVTFFSPEAADGSVQVVNAVGQVVFAQNLGNVNGEFTLSVPVTDLAAGTYMVKLNLGTRTFTQKLMVVK